MNHRGLDLLGVPGECTVEGRSPEVARDSSVLGSVLKPIKPTLV